MRKLLVLGMALALVAGTAYAAPNVYNNTQKGSLVFLPDIDVRAGKTTIVRLVNDGDNAIYVKCYFMDFEKNRTDFAFPMTPRQAVWFDAATGDGSVNANGMPPQGRLTGELICFAVNIQEAPIVHNHLAATATVMDFAGGSAYEYTGAAFYYWGGAPAPALINGQVSQDLPLNGTVYDMCGKYLIGQFSPTGAVLTTNRGDAMFLQNRLVVSSCTQDLRQDYNIHVTKLNFDIWNAHETKFTGAWDCADSWHETILGGKYLVKGAQPQNFTAASLGTGAAYYRVEGQKSTQCDNIAQWKQIDGTATKAEAVGLVGVQSTLIDLDGVVVAVGTNLNQAGTELTGIKGKVRYNPGVGTVEGRR